MKEIQLARSVRFLGKLQEFAELANRTGIAVLDGWTRLLAVFRLEIADWEPGSA